MKKFDQQYLIKKRAIMKREEVTLSRNNDAYHKIDASDVTDSLGFYYRKHLFKIFFQFSSGSVRIGRKS